jgi:peroxiredoxin family protein
MSMQNMTKEMLKEAAKQKDIKVPANATKADIIKLLEKYKEPAKVGKKQQGEY